MTIGFPWIPRAGEKHIDSLKFFWRKYFIFLLFLMLPLRSTFYIVWDQQLGKIKDSNFCVSQFSFLSKPRILFLQTAFKLLRQAKCFLLVFFYKNKQLYRKRCCDKKNLQPTYQNCWRVLSNVLLRFVTTNHQNFHYISVFCLYSWHYLVCSRLSFSFPNLVTCETFVLL